MTTKIYKFKIGILETYPNFKPYILKRSFIKRFTKWFFSAQMTNFNIRYLLGINATRKVSAASTNLVLPFVNTARLLMLLVVNTARLLMLLARG